MCAEKNCQENVILIIKVNKRNCCTRVSEGHDGVPNVKFVPLQDKWV